MLPGEEKEININKKFYDFIGILKDAGIPVSTSEMLDMFSALKHVDFFVRSIFKQALSSTLVKDFTDLPVFDKCFDAFFGRGFDQAGRPSLPESPYMHREKSSSVTRQSSEISSLKEREALEKFLSILPEALLLGNSAESILAMFLQDQNNTDEAKGKGEGREQVKGYGREGRMGQSLLRIIESEKRKRGIGKEIRDREERLLNKNIYQLTPDEIREMRELIRRFGQKLKNRITLRKKRVKHGALDIKRTIRGNLKNSGVLFRLSYRDRKVRKPRLVVLCDISSSVNQYSRFMLLLTYTLQGLFSQVRTFAFVSNVIEITGLFRDMDVERALNSIFSDTSFTYGFRSNYGKCFDEFFREHSDSLTSRTTVIILGDARNNYQDSGIESFEKIRDKAKNLFWLNTENRKQWDSADSIAGTYGPICTEMKEVKCFLDLSEFIDRLFV